MASSGGNTAYQEKLESAYLLYKSMGWKRSFSAVARVYEVSVQTVSNWARKNNWVNRLKKETEEEYQARKVQRDHVCAQDGDYYRQSVDDILCRFVYDVEQGNIKLDPDQMLKFMEFSSNLQMSKSNSTPTGGDSKENSLSEAVGKTIAQLGEVFSNADKQGQ